MLICVCHFLSVFKLLLQLLKKLSRVLYNVVVLFIPWEVRIKKIESETFFSLHLRMNPSVHSTDNAQNSYYP